MLNVQDDTYPVPSGGDVWAGMDAPLPQGFAAGSETGTYSSGLWTPARTAGVVNQASWDIVPTETWVRIADTAPEDLDAVVKAALPTWTELASWTRAWGAWTGFAVDAPRARWWSMCPGGHQDGTNNGIYGFEAYKMAWAVEKLPSLPSTWSDQYKNQSGDQPGTWTVCEESIVETITKFDASTLSPINDWYEDELFWDRTPCSRHTYSGCVYRHETRELIMTVGRLWKYSLDSHAWTYKRVLRDYLAKKVDDPTRMEVAVTRENVLAHIDTANGHLVITANPLSRKALYDLNSDAWLDETAVSMPWAAWGGSTVARRSDNKIAVFTPPNFGSNGGKYWLWDAGTKTTDVSGDMQIGGDLDYTLFSNTYLDSSAVYVESINRYWMVTRRRESAGNPFITVMLEIDPTTTPWTISEKTFTGGMPTINSTKFEERMVYIPTLDAVFMFYDGDLDGLVYKVS